VRLTLLDGQGRALSHLTSGERLRARIEVRFARAFSDPHVGFGIKNRHGLTVYETNTYCSKVPMRPVEAGGRITATFSLPCPLSAGDYAVIVGVANGGYGEGYFENSLFLDNACGRFQVLAAAPETIWAGVVNLDPEIEVEFG
jgi:lipopolysaccharide transport system ATP-binding protein